jgi:quinol-cytochrome oxidoreductase complex cytochrome b subunit
MGEKTEEEASIPFFPDHLWTEARVALGIIAIIIGIGVLGSLNPVGLGPAADPMETPAHTKPEWYFLFLYEVLKYVPKTIGSVLPFALVAILALWPFIDAREDNHRARRFRIIVTVLALIAVLALTALGELS